MTNEEVLKEIKKRLKTKQEIKTFSRKIDKLSKTASIVEIKFGKEHFRVKKVK
jgi:hypothetical protein